MDNYKLQIQEIERRIRAEREQLDKVIESLDSGDEIEKNKLEFLKSELDYINNQYKLVSEASEKKAKERLQAMSIANDKFATEKDKTVKEWSRAEEEVKEVQKAPQPVRSAQTVQPAPQVQRTVESAPVSPAQAPQQAPQVAHSAQTVQAAPQVQRTVKSTPVRPAQEPQPAPQKVVQTTDQPKPLPEFTVEEPIEIKQIKTKDAGKKPSVENRIGLMVMPILAASLIFISLILFANALPEVIGDIIKQSTMVVAGFSFMGAGLWLSLKKKGGAFGQILTAIGAGELFITAVLMRFAFKSINDLVLFILLFIWSILIIPFKKYANVLVHTIGELGILFAVVFGTIYCIAQGNHSGIIVVFAFFFMSMLLYYLLFRIKGSVWNFAIFHSFNICKILVILFTVSFAFGNSMLTNSVLFVLCTLVGIGLYVDVLVSDKANVQKIFRGRDIFCAVASGFYAVSAFISSAMTVFDLQAFFICDGRITSADRLKEIASQIWDERWLMFSVASLIVLCMLLASEFVLKSTFAKFFSEGIVAVILLGGLLMSHNTFKFGYILVFLIFTALGYIRKNHLLKITALLSYVIYAFIFNENILAILVGVLGALITLLLLYAVKNQYFTSYKITVYFGIVTYIITRSYATYQPTWDRGAGFTALVVALSILNVMVMFTPLSKDKEKKYDFIIIPEIMAIYITLTAMWTAFGIKVAGGSTGYIALLTSFVLVLLTLFRGVTGGRIICKINTIIALSFGMIILIPFKYSALWFGAVIIIAALVLLYVKDEWYSSIYKILLYLLALGYTFVCTGYFFKTFVLENFLNPINVVAVVITVITAAFKFTELRIDRRDDMNDMRIPTLVINVMVAFIASLFMKGSENLGDYLLALCIITIVAEWILSGFLSGFAAEITTAIVFMFFFVFRSATFGAAGYMIFAYGASILILFMTYFKKDAYRLSTKASVYALMMVNSVVCPILYYSKSGGGDYDVYLIINFVLLCVFNALFRYSPLCYNPETEEKDMRFTTIIVDNALVFLGIIATAIIQTSIDIIPGMFTILLVILGTLWIWTEDEDEGWVVTLRYGAVVEYVFVPFFLCYAMSAPVYMSSIVGIILSVGCIVLGFVTKMKGIRIYGLIVSMIMVFKLALVDFEKSSLLAYALSFFVAGIACLVISMLYYFVNAAVKNME